jgi:hypothetical protein
MAMDNTERYVRLEGKDGNSVWVNPDAVQIVEKSNSDDGNLTVLFFAGFHTLVKGEPADVVRALRGDTD